MEVPKPVDPSTIAALSGAFAAPALHGVGQEPGRPTGEFDVLLRVDTQTGAVAEWDSGTKVFDEVVFAAAEGGQHEQGYDVTFRTDLDTMRSDWVLAVPRAAA